MNEPAAAAIPKGALSGIRVCDFTGQLAGAGATKWLAAFGAEVIRIEDPVRKGNWDILRGMPPYKDGMTGLEYGGAFNNHNVGKLGITLNMKTEARPRDARRDHPPVGHRHREFRGRRARTLGLRLCDDEGDQAGHHLCDQLWLRLQRPLSRVQDLGADRPGGSRASPSPRACPASRRPASAIPTWTIPAPIIWRSRSCSRSSIASAPARASGSTLATTEAALTLNGPALLDWTVNGRPTRRPGQPDSNRSAYGAMAAARHLSGPRRRRVGGDRLPRRGGLAPAGDAGRAGRSTQRWRRARSPSVSPTRMGSTRRSRGGQRGRGKYAVQATLRAAGIPLLGGAEARRAMRP